MIAWMVDKSIFGDELIVSSCSVEENFDFSGQYTYWRTKKEALEEIKFRLQSELEHINKRIKEIEEEQSILNE